MQFPESWLREFCSPPLSTQALAHALTMGGMEVESLGPVAPGFSGVVVAAVLAVERHPNADRLNVCRVDDGSGAELQIVCGAPNVRAGIRVPCARVGAELPPGADGKPFSIKSGLLRGVESQGMLCSARELGLSEDHGGLLVLNDAAPVGQDLRAALDLDDTLFTLKLTPNLGHALSVYGVARELAALTGTPLHTPNIASLAPVHQQVLPVKVLAPDLCGRFSGRVIRGVNPKASTPAWMVDRLARCGQRSVSALVDISNYVMFEYGRPTHIFDLDKINGGLEVRWAREGESLKLLNGNTVALDEKLGAKVGVIADAHAVESLAGIMGGDSTAVGDDTRNVYVEAAFWWPEAVAGRSRRFNFSTDAGHRFERGVDPALTVAHIERITALILEICGGEPGPIDDQTVALPAPTPVTLRVERAAKVIGMPVSQAQCEAVFTRLGLQFLAQPGHLTVTPPSWRFDLRIEEDLIEELIRVIGYGNLPDTPPRAPTVARARSERSRSQNALRHTMAGLGYFETINFSFVELRWEQELAGNADPIRVLNPIAAPLAVMRSSLLGSLIAVLKTNIARRADRVRVYEIGRVFWRDANVPDGPLSVAGVAQPRRLAGLAWGYVDGLQWGSKDRSVDFFDAKGDVQALLAPQVATFVAAPHPALHPGRSAAIHLDGQAVGFVGELHPQWRQAYELPSAPVMFEIDLDALQTRTLPQAHALPRQQAAWRDVAVVAPDGVTHDQIIAAIHADPSGLVRSARLFDVYKPAQPAGGLAAGERSLAIRVELRDDDATLTDERIDATVAAALARLASQLGARLRA